MSRTYRRKDLMQKTDMEITEGKTLRDGKVEDGRVFHKIHGDQQYAKSKSKKIRKLLNKEFSKKINKTSKRRSIQEAMKTGESVSRDHLNHKVKTPRYI